METNNSQRMISETIRKIVLGRSIDRVNMSPSGTGTDMLPKSTMTRMMSIAGRLTWVSFPMRPPARSRLSTKACYYPEQKTMPEDF